MVFWPFRSGSKQCVGVLLWNIFIFFAPEILRRKPWNNTTSILQRRCTTSSTYQIPFSALYFTTYSEILTKMLGMRSNTIKFSFPKRLQVWDQSTNSIPHFYFFLKSKIFLFQKKLQVLDQVHFKKIYKCRISQHL